MTTSSDNAASLLERYQIHVGVGLLLVIAVGLMMLQVGESDELRSSKEKAIPPMPTTKVVVVENEVIEQVEVDYDVSLDLTTAVASGR